MELFKLLGRIVIDNAKANDEIDGTTDKAESSSDKMADAFKKVGKAIGTFLVVDKIKDFGSYLMELGESTIELANNQSKLTASLKDSGHSADWMKDQYSNLYGYLGDDMAVTNTILNMEKLGLSQKETAALTNSAIAVWTAYGDSIPLEGLAESINETVMVGQVTGTLADALNWAGISEDDFNTKLAKCNSEQERATLITETLNKKYEKIKKEYDEVNEKTIAYLRSQSNLEQAQTRLGQAILPVNTALNNIKSTLANALVPAVEGVISTFDKFIDIIKNGGDIGKFLTDNVKSSISGLDKLVPQFTEKALNFMKEFGTGIKNNMPGVLSSMLDVITKLSETVFENAPKLVAGGMELLVNLAQGIANSIPTLIEKVPTIVSNIANTISASIPIIIVKGAEIILALAKGIISSIPTLVANLPKVISAIIDVWNAINWMSLGKNLITGIVNGIKNLGGNLISTAKNLFGNLKTESGNIFNNIKNVITNPILTAKTKILALISDMKNGIVNVFNSIKSVTTSVWNGIKNAIISPLKTAQSSIKSIINAIKGFFNFKISWPKIPLPRFSITPRGWSIGDLLKGSIPKLGISWYAKGGIMKAPTLFGVNGNNLLGGGEAGAEAILPLDSFYKHLDDRLAQINNQIDYDRLTKSFVQALKNVNFTIEIDKTKIGQVLDEYNGEIINFREKGVFV